MSGNVWWKRSLLWGYFWCCRTGRAFELALWLEYASDNICDWQGRWWLWSRMKMVDMRMVMMRKKERKKERKRRGNSGTFYVCGGACHDSREFQCSKAWSQNGNTPAYFRRLTEKATEQLTKHLVCGWSSRRRLEGNPDSVAQGRRALGIISWG